MKKEEKSLSLTHLPVGDLFKTTSLTAEDYELFSKSPIAILMTCFVIDMKNTFYSSEYMKLLGESL